MNPSRRRFTQNPPAEVRLALAVPPGHHVRAYAVPTYPEPSLHPLKGGVCLISLGHGSDEPVEELDDLLRLLEQLMTDSQRPVLLSLEEGALSRLFARAHPAHQSLPQLLLWVFTRNGLKNWLEEPARLQALLRRLNRLQHSAEPITQYAYFEQDSGPGAAVMARLLAGLGLLVRVAEPAPDRLLLAEVQRPEGRVFTVLAGHDFPLEGDADTDLTTLNALKAEADARGDAPRLRQLEQWERDYLGRVLQPLQAELYRTPPLHAPRLCRLLRTAVEQGGPTARWELERELMERVRQLTLLLKPDGQSPLIAELPGIGPVLQVYPDLHSLQMDVKELGLAEDSYVSGRVAVRDLFAFGAQQNLPVAIHLSLTPYTSKHVRWSPAEARLIAKGQYATAAPSGNTLTPEQLRDVLTEADGYVEQGLYDKALQSLRRIFSCLPQNLDAHEKAYRIYVAAGYTHQALEQSLHLLRLCIQHAEVQRAQPYLTALLQQWPRHPELPALLAALRRTEYRCR